MNRIDFDSIRINGAVVPGVAIVRAHRSAPRLRRPLGAFTTTMELDAFSWSDFVGKMRAAIPVRDRPLFDFVVTTRKRLAPVLAIRLGPRGRRCLSYLRERFEREVTTLRGCRVESGTC